MSTATERESWESAQRRAQQMKLVTDVAFRLSSVLAVEELLWEVVRLIQTTFGYYYVHICTVDEEKNVTVYRAGWDQSGARRDLIGWELRVRDQGMVGWVAWSGEPLLVEDVTLDPRYYFDDRFPSTRSEVTVPIKRGSRTIGVLDAQDVRLGVFDGDDVALLETLARQISVAIENAALFEELVRSRTALEQKARDLNEFVELAARAQEEDRRRIGLDLHDGVAQLLVGIRFELETMRTARPALPPPVVERLGHVCRVLDECAEEIRRVIFDLYPPGLEDLGLVPALERYVAAFRLLSGLECQMKVLGRPTRLHREAELAAYRIVQGALANVFQHAQGEFPEVVLRFSGMGLRLTVQDGGPGFDVDNVEQGRFCYGLESMRRKAVSIGAQLTIRSAPGRGTTVTLNISSENGRPRRSSHA